MILLAFLAAQIATPAPAPICHYDRERLLALGLPAFDQDMTGGWRKLVQDGCEAQAADLIRDWRVAHASRESLLFWHEGQLRADIGQTAPAIALFEQSRKTVEQDHGFGWNHYVDGTIAFLRRDRSKFDEAKARLAALPRPAGLDMLGPDGKPVTIRWPLNMNVFEGFQRCWDRPYKQAYACATPQRRVTVPAAR